MQSMSFESLPLRVIPKKSSKMRDSFTPLRFEFVSLFSRRTRPIDCSDLSLLQFFFLGQEGGGNLKDEWCHSFSFFFFLVAERNSTSDPVCLFVCVNVCLSVCLFVCLFVCPKFCPKSFFYIIEEVLEVDELDEGNISAAAGKWYIFWMAELGCATLGLKLSSAFRNSCSSIILVLYGLKWP